MDKTKTRQKHIPLQLSGNKRVLIKRNWGKNQKENFDVRKIAPSENKKQEQNRRFHRYDTYKTPPAAAVGSTAQLSSSVLSAN